MFIIVIISRLKYRKKAGFICIFAVIYAVVAIGGINGNAFSASWNQRDFANEETLIRERQVETFLADHIEISPEQSHWENTVALYSIKSEYVRNSPAGTGWNLYLGSVTSINEGYVLLSIGSDELAALYFSRGYNVIASNGEVMILKNPMYA